MRKFLALASSAVLLLIIPIQGGEAQKSLRKWKNNLAVCNEVVLLDQNLFCGLAKMQYG